MAKKQSYANISKKGDYTLDDLDCALDALIEASEIMRDPQLMKLVQQHAKKKEKQVSSIKDLRDIANKMADEY